MRDRWLGATGLRVPEVAVEGEVTLPEQTLVVSGALDAAQLRAAFDEGRPIAVHAASEATVHAALAHPEVSCVLVPPDCRDLLALDLRVVTYG